MPEVIITEYNPSFLNHNISIPYEEFFNRIEKHKSGFYHGASLKAFTNLLKKYDYSLIKCIGGTNAVFSKNSIKENKNITSYEAEEIYQEGIELRNKWSKLDANSQFEKIKHLPFEKIIKRLFYSLINYIHKSFCKVIKFRTKQSKIVCLIIPSGIY